ncbi:MAG: hypothetical protein A3C08_00375 [Candidatus Taylorbacteria bacterium RIFCSPHIGHO2_02_FULL_47_18]|uniref:Serine protease n=1 Tax=Candidatus Taylorbacteria bacterium RIFCSPLOWO2_01_FULL_48_100 TaxID=1802322 RepID=A0A1G2NEP3_9BACT|nr:MAG: hypothetical protein A2670_00090 [Candidatus Taylorbacteria bacterium RIFCSPHIGHO2_01_FULL_48_38]OHA27817.1 MAG: hypothetical protein A3C08_00375 [Candidatus Taylorbacteria bacterium RIFCSPHIGHO2_02_FULL_47_18]OHA33929.1 MAG: hypothetical protein A2938_02815 [Candidatus Taylorbacteria bacterium RIFCSPLOWO2_01_FULL_48_100]OHA40903.1 MAG: hypothetical protein A3J31_03820 [Candidatus Taylorbacteria bacterium RIFCSPLOWO2_02_FULL_48_16]OHA45085.1 MAG: hypothetical protein A3H13_02755 [Candid
MFLLLALVGGATTLVVKNFQQQDVLNTSPTPVYSDVLKNISTATEDMVETPTTTPVAAPPIPKQKEIPVSVATTPIPLPSIPPTTSVVEPDWNTINEKMRGALTNVLCVSKNGDVFQPLSGSGVFIDPRGIILTNAHVAQYLLLTSGDEKSDLLDCTIRVGNPAVNRYRAEVFYISPRWITDNAKNLFEENPKERGENDYALLLVTETTNPNAQLPSSFPFIPLREKLLEVETRDAFLAAGYPAGFLGGIAVQRELYSVSSFATIQSRYTLGEDTLDIIGLGGNLLAQKGASGGAVVDGAGELVGLITTAIVEGNTDTRDVRALTTDYIARAFAEEAGFSLYELKNAALASLSEQFNIQIAPLLRKKLTDVIYKTSGN